MLLLLRGMVVTGGVIGFLGFDVLVIGPIGPNSLALQNRFQKASDGKDGEDVTKQRAPPSWERGSQPLP